ncbi:hypothetical protein VaNZ11_000921, partial [Volvox africanus]
NKAVHDNMPYNLDSSLKNPRVLIAKDIQRVPHLQPVWDKCFAAGFAQVADLQPRVRVDCFKKKWQKYVHVYFPTVMLLVIILFVVIIHAIHIISLLSVGTDNNRMKHAQYKK